MEEQLQEVLDRRIFAEQGCEASNLVRERSPNVLRLVLAEVADEWNHASDDDLLLKRLAKPCVHGLIWWPTSNRISHTWYLASCGRPDFSLIIFEKSHEMGHKFLPYELGSNSVGELDQNKSLSYGSCKRGGTSLK